MKSKKILKKHYLAIRWFNFFNKTRDYWLPVAVEYQRLEPIFLKNQGITKESLEQSKDLYFINLTNR